MRVLVYILEKKGTAAVMVKGPASNTVGVVEEGLGDARRRAGFETGGMGERCGRGLVGLADAVFSAGFQSSSRDRQAITGRAVERSSLWVRLLDQRLRLRWLD